MLKIKIYSTQNLEDLTRVLVLSGYKVVIKKIMKKDRITDTIDYFEVRANLLEKVSDGE